MNFKLITLFILFWSNQAMSMKSLLIYCPNEEFSFLFSYSISQDSILNLDKGLAISNIELTKSYKFSENTKLSYYFVEGRILRSGMTKKRAVNPFECLENNISKIANEFPVIKFSKFHIRNIYEVEFAKRTMLCGNINRKTKKILIDFSAVKRVMYQTCTFGNVLNYRKYM